MSTSFSDFFRRGFYKRNPHPKMHSDAEQDSLCGFSGLNTLDGDDIQNGDLLTVGIIRADNTGDSHHGFVCYVLHHIPKREVKLFPAFQHVTEIDFFPVIVENTVKLIKLSAVFVHIVDHLVEDVTGIGAFSRNFLDRFSRYIFVLFRERSRFFSG